MKKSFLFLFAAALIAACSNGSEENVVPSDGDTGGVAFSVSFEGSAMSRAPQTTAIPTTTWDKIASLQFLLYDATGVVRYSIATTPSTGTGASTTKTFTYADVPTGTYTLAVVANAASDKITNYIGSTVSTWNSYNVRQKNINTNLLLKHKSGSFPTFANAAMTGSATTGGANTAYVEPAEIFMGYATGINVTSGGTVSVPAVTLKREVSLMRIRLNVADTESGVVNTNTQNGVDFSQDASIMIHRLPEQLLVKEGNDGGVTGASSIKNNVLSISDGTVFNTQVPASGYSNPATMLSGNFTMWRDVVVFPNNGGRANNTTPNADAAADNMYYIVISGRGKVGHVLADGTTLQSETPVYWAGLIKGRFTPNVIREVNLTLKSGGTTVVPTDPTSEGSLTIVLSEPAAWDSNIVEESKIL